MMTSFSPMETTFIRLCKALGSGSHCDGMSAANCINQQPDPISLLQLRVRPPDSRIEPIIYTHRTESMLASKKVKIGRRIPCSDASSCRTANNFPLASQSK